RRLETRVPQHRNFHEVLDSYSGMSTQRSTGDVEHLAGNEPGRGGAEERGGFCDILRLPHAAYRYGLGTLSDELLERDADALRRGRGHVGLDETRRDGVGGHPESAEFDGEGLGE